MCYMVKVSILYVVHYGSCGTVVRDLALWSDGHQFDRLKCQDVTEVPLSKPLPYFYFWSSVFDASHWIFLNNWITVELLLNYLFIVVIH